MKKTRQDIINELRKTGINKRDAAKILQLFIDSIGEGIKKEGKVNIKNFGKFVLMKKNKKEFINPKTGKISRVTIPYKLKFIPSKKFIKFINEK